MTYPIRGSFTPFHFFYCGAKTLHMYYAQVLPGDAVAYVHTKQRLRRHGDC